MFKIRTAFMLAYVGLSFSSNAQWPVLDTLSDSQSRAHALFYYITDHHRNNDSLFIRNTIEAARKFALSKKDDKLGMYTDLFETVFSPEPYKGSPRGDTMLMNKNTFFENSKYPEIRASWYFFLGNHFFSGQKFETAFRYFLNATSLMEDIGYENIPIRDYYRYNLFQLHYKVGDYPAALRFYLDIRKDIPDEGGGLAVFDYNNIGVTYLKMGQYKQAESYFLKSLKYARLVGDSVYMGIASGNYGNALRLQKMYKQALPYLYADVANNQVREPSNSAITCMYIADCLIQLDSLSKAENYLYLGLQLQPNWVWTDFGLHYYTTRALFYKRTGRFQSATLYQDSLLQLRDRINKQNNVALFKEISLQFNEEKRHKREKQRLANESRLRNTRNFIIAGLVVVFALLLWLLVQKQRREKKQLLHRQHDSDIQLQQVHLQLESYLARLREGSSGMNVPDTPLVSNTLQPMAAAEDHRPTDQLNRAMLVTEEQWQHFKTLFLQIHPSFFNQLQQRYPALTRGETRLLALSKLQLPTKEMADMLGISQDSLRKSRYRLRKKFPGLQTDEEFKNHI